MLYHVANLSIDEIAQELGAPVGTVKARLARGRKALAPLVSEFDEESRHGTRADQVSQATHRREPSPRSEAEPELEFHHTRPE